MFISDDILFLGTLVSSSFALMVHTRILKLSKVLYLAIIMDNLFPKMIMYTHDSTQEKVDRILRRSKR